MDFDGLEDDEVLLDAVFFEEALFEEAIIGDDAYIEREIDMNAEIDRRWHERLLEELELEQDEDQLLPIVNMEELIRGDERRRRAWVVVMENNPRRAGNDAGPLMNDADQFIKHFKIPLLSPKFHWWEFPQYDTVRRYGSFPLLQHQHRVSHYKPKRSLSQSPVRMARLSKFCCTCGLRVLLVCFHKYNLDNRNPVMSAAALTMPDDFSQLGTAEFKCGYQPHKWNDSSLVDASTFQKRWMSLFGVSPFVCALIWNMLAPTINTTFGHCVHP